MIPSSTPRLLLLALPAAGYLSAYFSQLSLPGKWLGSPSSLPTGLPIPTGHPTCPPSRSTTTSLTAVSPVNTLPLPALLHPQSSQSVTQTPPVPVVTPRPSLSSLTSQPLPPAHGVSGGLFGLVLIPANPRSPGSHQRLFRPAIMYPVLFLQ